MENKDFDKFIRKGLEDVQPEYDPSDWDDMEDLLDKDETESRELVYIKGIELVLVLLTVVTLFRFYPDYNQISENPFQNQSAPITIIEDNNTATENNANSISTEMDNDINTTITKNESTALVTTSTVANNLSINTATINTYNKNFSTSELQLNNNSIIAEANIPQNTITTSAPTTTQSAIPSTNDTKEQIAEIETVEKEDVIRESFSLSSIEHLKTEKIDLDLLDKSLAYSILKPKFRMSFHVGLDRNFVSTPYDKDTESSFVRGNFGFSTGLNASIQKGRWEFGTGLSYARKSYKPTPVYEITGSVRDGYEAHTLKQLTFNTISMPLDMRFYFNNMSNKLKFYVTTGATFNAVAWSNYNRHSYEVKEVTNPADVIAGRPPNKIETKRAGIFHGESLVGNYYITANLGAGVEMTMNERTSLFAEPKFTYYLLPGSSGFGPNNDQFNTISLDIGLRFGF